MTSGYIPNFLSNSKEFLSKFGKQLVDAAKEVKAPGAASTNSFPNFFRNS